MADGGLPAPSAPPALTAPLATQPPAQPVQLPIHQAQPMQPVYVPQ